MTVGNKFVREARKASKRYAARASANFGGVDPQAVGEELERIYEKNGQLNSRDVVDEARPEDAVLHPAFEWDDAIAGEEWRNHQSRHVIKSILVVSEEEAEPTTVYVNVKTDEGRRSYQPIEVVVQHVDQYASAVMELQARINSATKALKELETAAGKSDVSEERMAKIHFAAKALATAYSAVEALH